MTPIAAGNRQSTGCGADAGAGRVAAAAPAGGLLFGFCRRLPTEGVAPSDLAGLVCSARDMEWLESLANRLRCAIENEPLELFPHPIPQLPMVLRRVGLLGCRTVRSRCDKDIEIE